MVVDGWSHTYSEEMCRRYGLYEEYGVKYRHVDDTVNFMFVDTHVEALTYDEVPYNFDHPFWEPQ